MLKKYQKYAPIGLFVGLAAAIAALILRIIAGQFSISAKICFCVSIIGLAAFVILDAKSILDFFKSRHGKYGSNSFILTLAVIGILVIVNLVIFNNDITWDLTEDKVNTLADETLDVLSNLQVSVSAQAYFTSNTSTDTAETLLNGFEVNASGYFSYEFIDPYDDPVAATEAGITQDGVIILSAEGQSQKVTTVTEENLINAVIKLQNPEETVIYALTGHGEGNFEGSGDYSLTELESQMSSKNYRIETLNLVSSPEIPEDAEAIFIAANQVPFDQSEVDLIGDYLAEGGSMILLSEPDFLTEIDDQTDPLAEYLMDSWGVTLGKDMIIDSSVDPVEYAIADQYGNHAILEEITGYVTFFPTSRSITLSDVDEVSSTELILTSSQSWAEKDTKGIEEGEAGYDDDDIAGPLTIAAALENSTTGARVVVVGDSDFTNDYYAAYYANLDFAMGIVDWAAENEAIISITSAEETSRVLVAPTNAAKLAILIGGFLGLPLIISVTGIIIAINRKRTG